jgi:nanoRNase/pAp phosphatase (c-di-AMP/oligoRNAs hydrolase)
MSYPEGKRRLLTRDDFDGVVSAALLKKMGLIEQVKFVHPRDMEGGVVHVSRRDIIADLPPQSGAHLAFDHHDVDHANGSTDRFVVDANARSAARVIYNHYGGADRFPTVSPELLDAVDKWESAAFVRKEVLDPEGWDLLGFLLDPRTGLGRFRRFRISNHQLMLDLIDYIADHDIEELLTFEDIKERADVYESHKEDFSQQIQRCSTVRDTVLLVDLRRETTLYAGNRFVKYALFPHTDASVQIMWAFKRRIAAISVGKSIFDGDLSADIGEVMARYGGGGYSYAGACQVPAENVDQTAEEIIEALID